MLVPLFNTYIHPTAKHRVAEILETTFLSEGKLVKEFEARLSTDLGFVHPVALNSGTSALHLAMVVAGIGAGDEVILSPQTFVASALVVVQQGAIPVFADIQYDTGNIDPAGIECKITDRTKAIMAVHWGGYPCDLDEIHAVTRKHGLRVIEDAAHAPGATYKDQPIGSVSDITCFSFQAIKHLTTGDGGAICCLDPELAHASFVRRWFGIDRANSPVSELGEREYDISTVGFKYHLNDYAAALGLANLEGFQERLVRRRGMAQRYRRELTAVPGLTLFQEKPDREGAYWLLGMHVEHRLAFIRALKEKGITASVVHDGIDHNSLFGGTRAELTNQLRFNQTQVHIPIHDALSDEQITHVITSIKQGW